MRKVDLAEAVRAARMERGWSQRSLAEAAGIPQSHVAKLENGADVRASTLVRVASALGLDVELRPRLRDVFEHPRVGGRIAAARDFGVDLGQLYACYLMSPSERLDAAAESNNGLADLFG